MPKKEDSFYHLKGEFSIVVHAKAGVDVGELLEKNTQWMGEPTNGDGVVVAMKLKSWHDTSEGPSKPSTTQEKEKAPDDPGYSKCGNKTCVFHGNSDVCKYPNNCRSRI